MLDRSSIRLGTDLGRDRILDGRRTLDLAQGILIGLRRYPTRAAFAELVTVARIHDLSVSAVALALVELAAGEADGTQSARSALAVARLVWGDSFGSSESGASEDGYRHGNAQSASPS